MSKPTFRLGITMAGAVSAGAYTAGVIDYLLETLDTWEKAKKTGDSSVPNYNVVLEVISGASAGGMTAAVTCMGLMDGITPINKQNPNRLNNKLYDAWVNMLDDDSSSTIDKLLSNSDLENATEISSLLNSNVVEQIGDKTVDVQATSPEFPPYISSTLDLIMTVSNLRGVPINIKYSNLFEPTRIVMHDGHYHYNFKSSPSEDDEQNEESIEVEKERTFLELDISDNSHREELRMSAISTGAFPFGFSPRSRFIDKSYILGYLRKKFHSEIMRNAIELPKDLEKNYEYVAVDGGLINNEPLALNYNRLREKIDASPRSEDYAIIMIDPFPSFDKNKEEYKPKDDILSTLLSIITALRNQVIFKQDDLFRALSDDDLTRFFLAPTKKNRNGGKAAHPLASGSLGGFSGFFSKEFREHDFMLGRKNCQNFLRYYFAVPESSNYDIHKNWTLAMKERFRFYRSEDNRKKKYFLPIIPDMGVIKAEGTPPNIKWKFKNAKLDEPKYSEYEESLDFKPFAQSQIRAYKPVVQERIRKIVGILLQQYANKDVIQGRGSNEDSLFFFSGLKKRFNTSWFDLKIHFLKWATLRYAPGYLSDKIVDYIIEDGIKEEIVKNV